MPGRGIIYGAHDNIEHVDTNPGYTGLLRPAGPVDPQITFLSVQSTSGKPIALFASYGLPRCLRLRVSSLGVPGSGGGCLAAAGRLALVGRWVKSGFSRLITPPSAAAPT